MLTVVVNYPVDYMTKNQMSDETELELAIELITEDTKKSLGKYLVEGLYHVSKKHPSNPFEFLGKWLLVQADLRDEKDNDQKK